MRPKTWLFSLFLFFIHAVAGKKNILFLAADDMRPNLGAYQNANKNLFKHPPMHTPNLDALADESLLFLNAFVQQALCSPSRTSLLTGRRPDTTRITVIGPYWRDMGGNFTTIPQFFKEHGYRTLGGGKIFHGGSASNDEQKDSMRKIHIQMISPPFGKQLALMKRVKNHVKIHRKRTTSLNGYVKSHQWQNIMTLLFS